MLWEALGAILALGARGRVQKLKKWSPHFFINPRVSFLCFGVLWDALGAVLALGARGRVQKLKKWGPQLFIKTLISFLCFGKLWGALGCFGCNFSIWSPWPGAKTAKIGAPTFLSKR